MPLSSPTGATQADLDSNMAKLQALIPPAAKTPPPGINVAGAVGETSSSFARADHTHASSVQRERIQVLSGNTITWTYPKPYNTPPNITYGVENTSGAALPYIANIVGQPGLNSVTLQVFKAQTTTLGGALTALLGLVISPFTTNSVTGIYVHVMAALPTPQ